MDFCTMMLIDWLRLTYSYSVNDRSWMMTRRRPCNAVQSCDWVGAVEDIGREVESGRASHGASTVGPGSRETTQHRTREGSSECRERHWVLDNLQQGYESALDRERQLVVVKKCRTERRVSSVKVGYQIEWLEKSASSRVPVSTRAPVPAWIQPL